MKKNTHDQNGAKGIIDTAVGYAINAKPGPEITKQITGNYTFSKRDWYCRLKGEGRGVSNVISKQ